MHTNWLYRVGQGFGHYVLGVECWGESQWRISLVVGPHLAHPLLRPTFRPSVRHLTTTDTPSPPILVSPLSHLDSNQDYIFLCFRISWRRLSPRKKGWTELISWTMTWKTFIKKLLMILTGTEMVGYPQEWVQDLSNDWYIFPPRTCTTPCGGQGRTPPSLRSRTWSTRSTTALPALTSRQGCTWNNELKNDFRLLIQILSRL